MGVSIHRCCRSPVACLHSQIAVSSSFILCSTNIPPLFVLGDALQQGKVSQVPQAFYVFFLVHIANSNLFFSATGNRLLRPYHPYISFVSAFYTLLFSLQTHLVLHILFEADRKAAAVMDQIQKKLEAQTSEDDTSCVRPYEMNLPADSDAGLSEDERKAIV